MKSTVIESCWKCLTVLRQKILTFHENIEFCSLHFGNVGEEQVFINTTSQNKAPHNILVTLGSKICIDNYQAHIQISENLHFNWQSNYLPSSLHFYLEVYIPYCFANIYANKNNKSYVVSHVAQSLDGCIATMSGNSKWIGNKQNLIHAHRMRALCDGVLVGKKTLENDAPQLNVRHVSGQCPVRIVVGGKDDLNFCSLIKASAQKIIHFSTVPYSHPHVDVLPLPKKNNELCVEELRRALYKNFRLNSLYVEGGATTISTFLQQKQLNIMQIHISPLVVGDGLRVKRASCIKEISEAQKFAHHRFVSVGDEIMFIGIPV